MGLRVFLTGASGYLGGVLAAHLDRLPEVESITGVGLSAPGGALPSKVRFRQMDIRSPDLAAAMAGHEVVIHTACVVLWSARMPATVRDDINLNGTRNVAQAARTGGVRRFLHASSMAVYDPHLARGQSGVAEDFPKGGTDSFFYYWSTKARAEAVLAETLAGSPMVLTLLRPIYIVGPRNRCTVAGLRANAVNLYGGDPRRQFIHEDDVAAAFLQALLEDLPGPYNVVPDDFLRMSEVWPMVGRRFVPTLPAGLARWMTALRWRWLGSPIHPSWVADMLVDFTGSNARLKRTGWRPRHTSAEALRSAR
jgi:UDP-glucose 4-epimerase